MKHNPWTLALVGAGLVSLPSITQAEEKPNALATALSATTISGYVDTSAQWNFGTGNDRLPPYAFGGTSKADGFNLNVVKLTIEKPLEPADSWGAGYKVDLLFGPDANSFGTSSTGIGADAAVKQAYVSLRAPVGNGLDFKIGVWDPIIGYEVFESGSNPNFTRSYGYTIEPFSHTGVLMSYQFCEAFTMNFGIANTVGPRINERAFGGGIVDVNGDGIPDSNTANKAESYKTYMGSFTLTAPKDWGFLAGSTLSAGIVNGFNSALGNETSYYVGSSINTPLTNLKAGFAFDYLNVADKSGETWTLGGYVSFQATEKLSFYGRAEYLRDRGEQKVFGPQVDPDGDGTFESAQLAPDKVMSLTATAQYDLWKNVMSRIEFRWDHSLSGEGVWGTSSNPTTGQGTLQNQFVLLANLIYKF